MRTSARATRGSGFKAAYIMLFILGVAAFLVANVVTYFIAHPTFPSPGPLSDVHKVVYVIFGTILLIALLGQPGRWFSAGFATGLLGMMLPGFLMSFTQATTDWVQELNTFSEQWVIPEGTIARDLALASRMSHSAERGAKQAEVRFVTERNKSGLDAATGGRDLLTGLMCANAYHDRFGEYPRERGKMPGYQACEGVYTTVYNESDGWELTYDPITDAKDHVTRFHLRAGPDARLAIDGPWFEVDEQGVITKRDHTGEPARGVSPMIGVLSWVTWCIDRNREAYAVRGNPSATLDDMIFNSKVKCAGISPLQHSDRDPYGQTNPNDLLYLLEERSNLKIKTIAVYDFSYVPRGFTLPEGYDLYLVPRKGESGIRSYLRSADGAVHVTTETRRATVNDPLALPCELHGNEICAR